MNLCFPPKSRFPRHQNLFSPAERFFPLLDDDLVWLSAILTFKQKNPYSITLEAVLADNQFFGFEGTKKPRQLPPLAAQCKHAPGALRFKNFPSPNTEQSPCYRVARVVVNPED